MANTLNFGAAAKAGTFETPLQSVSDKLMQYGKVLNERENIAAREKLAADRDAYQKSRDTLQDTRYDADKKQKADENAALANYANQTNMFQYGNALTTSQGQEISDMANNLTDSGVTGVDFDKQLNDRVSRMQSENTARLKDNPMAVLQNVKENVVVPQGVDPSKIIQINQNLEDKFMRMQEKKDDLAWKEKESKLAEQRFNQTLAEQRADRLSREKERLDIKKDKIDEEKAIINTFNASSGVDDNLINSNKKTVTTDKVILDETKKEGFNKDLENLVSNDKTLNENNNVILNEGSKVLTPEQKTDEALINSYEKEIGKGKSTFSSAGGLITSLEKSSEINEKRAEEKNNATRELDKKINSLLKPTFFMNEVDKTKLNSELESLKNEKQNILSDIDKKYKNQLTSNITFEDYKKQKISDSNTAENRIKNSVNAMENRTKELQNSLLRDKTKGYSKFETKDIIIPVSENTYKKRYYEEMVKNNPNMTKADQIAFMKESTIAASEYAKQNALKEKEAEKAEAARIEKLGDTEKERLGLIKDKVKELRQKVLSYQDSPVPKTGYRIKGEEVKPEEYFDAISSEYADAEAELNKALNSAEAKFQPKR